MIRYSIVATVLGVAAAIAVRAEPPVIPGLSREVRARNTPGRDKQGLEALDARVRGLVLLGELGCASCHAAGARAELIDTRKAPDLSSVGARVNPEYLKAFIADPHEVKPGTTMPDALGASVDQARRKAADALTHFLVSLSPRGFSTGSPDRDAATRGAELFHSIGCVACHSPRDASGREIFPEGSVPLGQLERKYGTDALAEFLAAPHQVRPSRRMPDLHLNGDETYELAHYLTQGERASLVPFQVDAAKAAEGATLFSSFNCVHCHRLPSADATAGFPALADLRPLQGCLSGSTGSWPSFALSPSQKNEIRAVLADPAFVPTTEERIRQTLAAFNCIACHRRGAWGGVTKARNGYYTSVDPNLGESGRLPPALTGVGAKLQLPWLRKTIAQGQTIRPYIKMRMPAFGSAAAGTLAERFAEVDRLPAVTFEPLPGDSKKAKAIKDVGHQLVGDRGMSCITCHTFRGRGSSSMAAVDLVETTTTRLQKNWFHHYMLDPVRFRSSTIMPQYFPDGMSVLPDIAGGDPRKQLNAMWHYLADGRNTRAPRGMARPPMEIVVGDEAVILRRSVEHTGKRGISVGYPLGVNLSFDAESVAVNQIWRGRFIDPAGVWTGQGSGAARIVSRDRIDLGKGPAFAELPSETAPWPVETSRDLGARFKGYELDGARRPTFIYTYADVAITDRPLDLLEEKGDRPYLRRSLHLRASEEKTLYFRALVHPEIQSADAATVAVGKVALIRALRSSGPAPLGPATFLVRPSVESSGETSEAIVAIPIRAGRATLVLEYRWLERSR